ncbi:MAG TPA: Arm DNA-binding domain-containing protein, partial [Mesorhizobium sp.]
MPLKELEIKNARESGKLTDGRGLYLLVQATGSKLWRFDYRFAGKRKTLAMGQYPEVKLSEARRKHEDARRLLKSGIDPSAQRRQEKVAGRIAQDNTFGLIASEYLGRLKEMGRAETTSTKNKW